MHVSGCKGTCGAFNVCACIHVCMYAHLAKCMCVRRYVPACINMYACICEHVHVCTTVCMHVYTCVFALSLTVWRGLSCPLCSTLGMWLYIPLSGMPKPLRLTRQKRSFTDKGLAPISQLPQGRVPEWNEVFVSSLSSPTAQLRLRWVLGGHLSLASAPIM